MIATPVTAYKPDIVVPIDGKTWLYFYNGGTFEEFQAMPEVLMMNGVYYAKRGWNSDTNALTYEETPKAELSFPCK